jgi:hypothetical protein
LGVESTRQTIEEKTGEISMKRLFLLVALVIASAVNAIGPNDGGTPMRSYFIDRLEARWLLAGFTSDFHIDATLVNADTGSDVRALSTAGNTIDLSKDGTALSVRATPSEQVVRIDFTVTVNSTVTVQHSEGLSPYTLLGDSKDPSGKTVYTAWKPIAGTSGEIRIVGVASDGTKSAPAAFAWTANSGPTTTRNVINVPDGADLVGFIERAPAHSDILFDDAYMSRGARLLADDIVISGTVPPAPDRAVGDTSTLRTSFKGQAISINGRQHITIKDFVYSNPKASGDSTDTNELLGSGDLFVNGKLVRSCDDINVSNVWTINAGLARVNGVHHFKATNSGCLNRVNSYLFYFGDYGATRNSFVTLEAIKAIKHRSDHLVRGYSLDDFDMHDCYLDATVDSSTTWDGEPLKDVSGNRQKIYDNTFFGPRIKFGQANPDETDPRYKLTGVYVLRCKMPWIVFEPGASDLIFEASSTNGGHVDQSSTPSKMPNASAGFVACNFTSTLIDNYSSQNIGFKTCTKKGVPVTDRRTDLCEKQPWMLVP